MGRFIHGDWQHLFENRREREVRIAIDRLNGRVVAMEIKGRTGYIPSSKDERADVEESLIHGNDVLDDPDALGLETSGALPAWAQGAANNQKRDRRTMP